jgi:hypothetical protein
MIHIKYCKKCGEPFDIGTNYDLCPRCRYKNIKEETKMEETKTAQPTLGAWDKLPIEESERKPKINFEIGKDVEVTFECDEPREFIGDNGAYYLFDVLSEGEQKVIMTSAWTLLRNLKLLSPLQGKKIKISKKLVSGKQTFEVKEI